LTTLDIRDAQAEEMALDTEPVTHPIITGGDFNTFFYFDDLDKGVVTEPAIASFLDRGHRDAHRDLPLADRYTSYDPFPMVIDLILTRGLEVTVAGRCPPERCGDLSDHLPVFAEIRGIFAD
jgi:endonuclease/exonuclease/phosphatase family metal-dependent hydrolase